MAPAVDAAASSRQGAVDVGSLATAIVTSESPDHPIEHALEGPTGRGSPRWVAAQSGQQMITLAFDAPQTVDEVRLEVEDATQERTQELALAVSHDGEGTYQTVVRQEFNFAPSGATWQHESWRIAQRGVTHLRLTIIPNKGGGDSRAMLTALVLR